MSAERSSKPERPKRIFRLVETGGETQVWSHRREGTKKEGRTYLKNFTEEETLESGNDTLKRKEIFSGITEEYKQELEQRYKALRAQYGNMIARQWFIRIPEIREDLYYRGEYVVSQERVIGAKQPDIFGYESDQLPDSVRKELQSLVTALKDSYRRFLRDGAAPDNHPLDLYGFHNLMVTADGHIKYIDTGLAQTTYQQRKFELVLQMFLTRLAALDYIAHGDVEAVCNDPLYADLMRCYSKHDKERLLDPKRIVNILYGTSLDVRQLRAKHP